MHLIHEESTMKKFATPMLVLAALVVAAVMAIGNSTNQTLPFSQNWTNTALIATNNDWSAVPGIVGRLGDGDAGSPTGVDPQTITADYGSATDFVFANQVTTFGSGGPAEMDGLADPTIAVQGSGTADAPHIIIYINSVGKQSLNLAYNLRDIDCATFAITQQFNAQYRVGGVGAWTNIAGGYTANASSGVAGECTKVTALSLPLPAACDNQSDVQLRLMTTNAPSTDDYIGIDDITVTGSDIPTPTNKATWGKVKTIFRY
jgi:hypothetical protein